MAKALSERQHALLRRVDTVLEGPNLPDLAAGTSSLSLKSSLEAWYNWLAEAAKVVWGCESPHYAKLFFNHFAETRAVRMNINTTRKFVESMMTEIKEKVHEGKLPELPPVSNIVFVSPRPPTKPPF